jgi:HAE1 family hydrophobic/amphiphilic exporter-1
MSLIQNFIKNPVKVTVFVILLVMFGLIAINQMPIQLIPDVQIPSLTIETVWPGASPQEIEKEIIDEQEEQLKGVEGVTKMSSESTDSRGTIMLEFAMGTDLDAAITTVNARLQQVREYPVDADRPVISTSNASDRPIGWFIVNQRLPDREEIEAFQSQHPQIAERLDGVLSARNPGLAFYRLREIGREYPEAQKLLPPPIELADYRRFTEDVVEARLEKVPGVSQANVFGGREEELQVIVNPELLAARRLTIADLRRALVEQNIDISGGDFWEGKRRWVVRTMGRFRDPKQVADVVVTRVGGSPVYIRDVAEVKLGFKKPDGTVRRYGTSVIAVNCLRRTGTNILEVQGAISAAVAELNDGVLKAQRLQLAQVYDETEYINSSIDLVWENISEGAVLTVIVLMLFLRSFRSTVVVFISIAVSIVGMFLMMSLMGRTLNVPSLAGIAFAVGMLVDNFIVVLENAHRHRQMGKPAFKAALDGASEVWGAVVTSTLANLAVFIPVLFVQDQAGQLFRDIALATASALVLSLLVAVVLVPTASARILGETRFTFFKNKLQSWETNGHPQRTSNRMVAGFRRMMARFDSFGASFVRWVTSINTWVQARDSRLVAVSAAFIVITFGLTLLLLRFTKIEYLPVGNRNLVIAMMLPPPGYNLDQMQAMGVMLEEKLKPFWDTDESTVMLPVPDEKNPGAMKEVEMPAIGDFFYVARGRQLFVGLRAKDPERAAQLVPTIMSVTTDMPGVMTMAFQSSLFEQGLTAGRNIDLEITGPDIRKLVAIGGQIFGMLPASFPETTPEGRPAYQAIPRPSLDLSSPELHVTAKAEQAEDQGIRTNEIGYAVNALVDGAYATDYYHEGDKIDLSIVGGEQFAHRTQDLEQLWIATPQGMAQLGAVANVQYASGPEQINHRERDRAITVQVTPPPMVPLEEALDRIQANIIQPLADSGQINDGLYRITPSGTADKLRQAWDAMKWNLALAFIITYLVMAALFESWLYPFVIILSVPLGAVGGFFGLWLLNVVGAPFGIFQALDVLTMLGFIILIGTVVNNPILIVEQALNLIENEGLGHREAVVESVRTRIRPIFMTTLIGFFGLLPLVLSPGAGSELYRGLGSVLLGGLLVSTVFTLFLVPSLFSLALEVRDWIASRVSFLRPTERHDRVPALVDGNGEHQPQLEGLSAKSGHS